jgi:hypothetical protein
MKATCSVLAGLCVLDAESAGEPPAVVNVVSMARLPASAAHVIAGAVQDWRVIEGTSPKTSVYRGSFGGRQRALA